MLTVYKTLVVNWTKMSNLMINFLKLVLPFTQLIYMIIPLLIQNKKKTDCRIQCILFEISENYMRAILTTIIQNINLSHLIV